MRNNIHSWPAFLVMMVVIFAFIALQINNSPVLDAAMQRVQESPQARAALGTPIERGTAATGDIGSGCSNKYESIETKVSVSGPRGEGTLWIDGRTSDGGESWTFEELELEVDGGPTLNLVRDPRVPPTNPVQ